MTEPIQTEDGGNDLGETDDPEMQVGELLSYTEEQKNEILTAGKI